MDYNQLCTSELQSDMLVTKTYSRGACKAPSHDTCAATITLSKPRMGPTDPSSHVQLQSTAL